ncbi:MAG TPA: 4Fe-4S binding protein [Coriobacteriia bacterium]
MCYTGQTKRRCVPVSGRHPACGGTPITDSNHRLPRANVRRAVQFVSLAVFVLLTVAGVGAGFRWLPENLFSRLDPLVALTAIVASRTRLAFWAIAFVTVAATVIFGRAWCGWVCPVGTLLDVMPARGGKKSALSRRWRLGKYVVLALVVAAALLGHLSPMVLDPVTVLTRPLQELARPFYGADGIGRNAGVEFGAESIRSVALLSLLPLVGVLALNSISRRTWCRTLCPLGGLLALLAKAPGIRRVVDAEKCTSCARCARDCPTDAVEREQGFASSAAECTVCLKCSDSCPSHAISFEVELGQLLDPGYRPDRRDALIGVGASALSLATVMLPIRTAEAAEVLRPPSTDDKRLSQLCIRCGACFSACPAGALRPSLSVTDPAGLWTPMLDERPAICSLNCNRCARVCPTDALHTPTQEERVALGLGSVAQVDRSRCRAWYRAHSCMLCQSVCPINGAIIAADRAQELGGGTSVSVPVVDPAQCVACNVCATACPIHPTAIYAPKLPPGAGI